jgi:hypothetical protein
MGRPSIGSEQKFIEEYRRSGKARESALFAGYSFSSAAATASRLINKHNLPKLIIAKVPLDLTPKKQLPAPLDPSAIEASVTDSRIDICTANGVKRALNDLFHDEKAPLFLRFKTIELAAKINRMFDGPAEAMQSKRIIIRQPSGQIHEVFQQENQPADFTDFLVDAAASVEPDQTAQDPLCAGSF